VRAGNDDATIDVERHVGKPRFVEQVRYRDAFTDASAQQSANTRDLATRHGPPGRRLERQTETAQHEKSRFVARVRRAMAVVQGRPAQLPGGVADQLAEGQGRSARSMSK
jgi:hypothetical protein